MALKEYISEQDFFDYLEAFPEQENLYEKKIWHGMAQWRR